MSRRTALATALAIVLTVVTASLAVAANLGMLSDEEPVGRPSPVTMAGADGTRAVPTDAPTIYVESRATCSTCSRRAPTPATPGCPGR